MANALDKLVIELDIKGLEDIKGLAAAMKNLKAAVAPTGQTLDKLKKSLKEVLAITPNTIQGFRKQERALVALRNGLDITGNEFKEVSIRIKEVREEIRKLNAMSVKPKGGKGMMGGMAGGRAAVGAIGTSVVGSMLPGSMGQGAMTGGIVGGAASGTLGGGLRGGFIGAGIGAVVDLAGFAKSAAEYHAEIKRLDIALRAVTKTDEAFAYAQGVVLSVSRELNVPIDVAQKQFTQLSASVIGAGGNVRDAEIAFRGVSEAIKGTGGNAEDVKSGIRAMTQIFGKGKVSAEELQGQLGERLAGAVVKFAESAGWSLQRLQKELRDGTVGLNEVMGFTADLSVEHREAALAMAQSSAEAGARMNTAFLEFKNNFGGFFQGTGAAMQDFITSIFRFINRNQDALKKWMASIRVFAGEVSRVFQGLMEWLNENFGGFFMGLGRMFIKVVKGMQTLMSKLWQKLDMARLRSQVEEKSGEGRYYDLRGQAIKETQTTWPRDQYLDVNSDEYKRARDKRLKELMAEELGLLIGDAQLTQVLANFEASTFQSPSATGGDGGEGGPKSWKEAMQGVGKDLEDTWTAVQNTMTGIFDKIGDALTNFVMTGKLAFKDLARSIVQSMAEIAIQQMILNPFKTWFSGLKIFNADGNVYAENGIKKFARGGIVNSPTLFPFANGMGLMGEAGPEAIMPLKRGASGKLGVESSGGSGGVVVNVDASGSSAEGDEAKSEALGEILGAAIQAELINQQRPGGLLA